MSPLGRLINRDFKCQREREKERASNELIRKCLTLTHKTIISYL
jgi:hypothetical protein